MSDEIVGNEPSSTEPSAPVASVEEGKPIESGSITESTQSADTSIPSGSATSSAGEAGNVAAAVEGGAPVTGDVAADGGDLPRESHLMLLKAKLAALEAKIGTGALIVKAEFAEIMAHIEAVL